MDLDDADRSEFPFVGRSLKGENGAGSLTLAAIFSNANSRESLGSRIFLPSWREELFYAGTVGLAKSDEHGTIKNIAARERKVTRVSREMRSFSL